MARVTSYLSSLAFKKEHARTFQAKYLKNIRFVFLLVVAIVLMGTLSLTTIPRRLNPEINIPIVNVFTILPGASPESVESLVTIPIEDELKKLNGLDTVTSVSSANISTISLQFTSRTNSDKARADVQTAVDTAAVDLPNDAQVPNVKLLDFEDRPVYTFVLTTDASEASLARTSKELRDKIDALKVVDRTTTSGLDEERIEIALDQAKIQQYGIAPFQVQQLVSSALKSYPAGTIETDTLSFALSIDPEATSVEGIRQLPIKIGSTVVQLSEIANIALKPKPDQPSSFFGDSDQETTPAVTFSVFKTKNTDIDAASRQIQKTVTTFIASKKGSYEVHTILDTADEIVSQFNDLFDEFKTTILLVFVLLFIFLGIRQAVIASATIPLTFLSSIAIIERFNMSLNFLTLFAFLLALGLLIDDTIVVVAAMTRYYKTGKFTPMQTGILVWKDFIVPLWSTTMTTIWAFIPLLLASGIIGEFIKPIPLVVTITMLSSTSIAMLITIPMMVVILKFMPPKRVVVVLQILGVIAIAGLLSIISPKSPIAPLVVLSGLLFLYVVFSQRVRLLKIFKKKKRLSGFAKSVTNLLHKYANHGVINIELISFFYMRHMRTILSSKYARRAVVTFLIVFAVVGFALVPLGFVKSEFFPKTDEDLLYVDVELPPGTNIQTTEKRARELNTTLNGTEDTLFVVTQTGSSASNGFSGSQGGSNFFNTTIHLKNADDRSATSGEIAERLRDSLAQYKHGKLSVQEVSGGPPAGADIEIKLLGPDLEELNTIAQNVQSHLNTIPKVLNVDQSIKPGASKYVFMPDNDALSKYGVTIDQVGFWLRIYASGFDLDTLKTGADETDITLVFSDKKNPQNVSLLSIPTQNGNIPITQLGHFTLESNPTTITRENGDRTLSVTAGVAAGENVNEKNKEITSYMETLSLPPGYSWKTGGVNEENTESVESILRAMVISALLILITMVIEFKSFRQAAIALLIIPFSVAGVMYIFALFSIPLSFPALIGVLALFGIVVTHVIVVIEKINENRKEGLNLLDSVVDAAGNRLEPVVLTSFATIVGLIPITYSDPLWRGLGGAIIAGLLFSDAVKLLLVPILYYVTYASQEKIRPVS